MSGLEPLLGRWADAEPGDLTEGSTETPSDSDSGHGIGTDSGSVQDVNKHAIPESVTPDSECQRRLAEAQTGLNEFLDGLDLLNAMRQVRAPHVGHRVLARLVGQWEMLLVRSRSALRWPEGEKETERKGWRTSQASLMPVPLVGVFGNLLAAAPLLPLACWAALCSAAMRYILVSASLVLEKVVHRAQAFSKIIQNAKKALNKCKQKCKRL